MIIDSPVDKEIRTLIINDEIRNLECELSEPINGNSLIIKAQQ